jgi:hypothetical protein
MENKSNIKRACLQKNTTCLDSLGNTDEQNSGEFSRMIGAGYPADNSFEERPCHPKEIQLFKSFVQMKTLTYYILSITQRISSGDSRCNGIMDTLVIDNSDIFGINAVITGVSLSGDSRRYYCEVAQEGDETPSFKAVLNDFAINPSGDSRQHSNKCVGIPAYGVAGVSAFIGVIACPSGDPRHDCTIKMQTL